MSCGVLPQSAQTSRLASFFILLLYDPRSLQYSDLNCAMVARSFLVRFFSESLIGCGRPSNTIFVFSDI